MRGDDPVLITRRRDGNASFSPVDLTGNVTRYIYGATASFNYTVRFGAARTAGLLTPSHSVGLCQGE
jgi:hypothetical protein